MAVKTVLKKAKDGTVYRVTAPASSSSSSSGGSKGGSSGGSGGGSSKVTYDNNTDYQSIINDAVARGDYVAAAQAEQQRNQKITDNGLNYATTNKYSGWLDSTDYSTIGRQQMDSGASWQDVLETYNNRADKASGTVGLEQYVNDDFQKEMLEYILNNQNAEDFTYDEARPTYNNKYDAQMEALLYQILNRKDFSYDVGNDPLYQQYAQMYKREGDRAMRETMAEAAAQAGGMNSYAITAAQQANNYYNSQMNDKIPELYQLAYSMYLQDKESQVQDLGLLQSMDATQYNRYRDTMNDWYNDRNFAYGVYRDDVNQGNWQKEFNYNTKINDRDFNYNDMWKNKEWDASQEENAYNKNQYEQESAKEEVWRYIELGITPSAELIARAGMSESDVALAIAAVKAQQAKKTTSSGGSGGGSYVDTGKRTVEDEGGNGDDIKYTGGAGVIDLGIGPISDEALLKLAEYGAVIINADGTVQWAEGYGPHNYQKVLDNPWSYGLNGFVG